MANATLSHASTTILRQSVRSADRSIQRCLLGRVLEALLPIGSHPLSACADFPFLPTNPLLYVPPSLPRQNGQGALLVRLPNRSDRPRYCGESASATAFRGLHDVDFRCGPHAHCTPCRALFLKCFRPFVASWSAPSVSGRSESSRVGISPTKLVHLSQGTHNAFAESLFRTAKYRPEFPHNGFADLESAREWVVAFVRWDNHEHRKSGIAYVTPAQRHAGEDHSILAARHVLYTQARAVNPTRSPRHTRGWSVPGPITHNPERDSIVTAWANPSDNQASAVSHLRNNRLRPTWKTTGDCTGRYTVSAFSRQIDACASFRHQYATCSRNPECRRYPPDPWRQGRRLRAHPPRSCASRAWPGSARKPEQS